MNIKSSVAVACFLPGRAKDLSAPLYTGGETWRSKNLQHERRFCMMTAVLLSVQLIFH